MWPQNQCNMKLSIKDRINFSKIFGANQDDLTSATVRKGILSIINFTQQEIKDISLVYNQGRFNWNTEKAVEIDFEFNEAQTMYLKESVFTASKARLIVPEILHICNLILMLNINP